MVVVGCICCICNGGICICDKVFGRGKGFRVGGSGFEI